MSCDIIDDIEDILKKEKNEVHNEEDIVGYNRASNKSFILPKTIKKTKELFSKTFDQNDQIEKVDRKINGESNVPGVASIYVKTWGCTHNSSDSEYMAGQLAAYGYKLVGKIKHAAP